MIETPQSVFDFLLSVGGTPVAKGGHDIARTPYEEIEWNFGLLQSTHKIEGLWMDGDKESKRYNLMNSMPKFEIKGKRKTDPKKVILTDIFKHPKVLSAKGFNGKVFPGFRQVEGSCVGSGAGNLINTLNCIEVATKNDPEEPFMVWWPFHYGRGRFRGGMTRPGHGSFSQAQVEAFEKDGVIRQDLDGLPNYSDNDGYVLSSSVETQWSDGDAPTSMQWVEKARTQLIQTVAPIRDADDAREAIINGYPFMFCGMWGGLMKCPVVGTPPVLLNRGATTWSHNETCIAWYDHPELGELFGVWNQWGLQTHGTDPAGLPGGAYWIKKVDMEKQIRGGDCIVPSNLKGYPARDLDFWRA